MEDFLREEGMVQSSEVELQDTSNRVHVMVILVPCQWVLTCDQMRREKQTRVRKDNERAEQTHSV